MRYHLAQYCAEEADIVINPKVRKTSWTGFINGQTTIKRGEIETKLLLPEIKRLIQIKTK